MMISSLARCCAHSCSAYPAAHLVEVGDGQAASAAYQQAGADLVISNWEMATMDGRNLVRALRPAGVTLPVILISRRRDPGLAQQARKAGATVFLDKGVLGQQLVPTLRGLLPWARRWEATCTHDWRARRCSYAA